MVRNKAQVVHCFICLFLRFIDLKDRVGEREIKREKERVREGERKETEREREDLSFAPNPGLLPGFPSV